MPAGRPSTNTCQKKKLRLCSGSSSMVWKGARASASAYSSSSARVAWRLKLQKLTPSAVALAQGGKRDPGRVACGGASGAPRGLPCAFAAGFDDMALRLHGRRRNVADLVEVFGCVAFR